MQERLTSLGFQVDLVTAAQDLLGKPGDLADKLVKPLTDLALFSLGIVGNLLIVIFLSLFIVIDKDRILAFVNRIVPPRYSERRACSRRACRHRSAASSAARRSRV